MKRETMIFIAVDGRERAIKGNERYILVWDASRVSHISNTKSRLEQDFSLIKEHRDSKIQIISSQIFIGEKQQEFNKLEAQNFEKYSQFSDLVSGICCGIKFYLVYFYFYLVYFAYFRFRHQLIVFIFRIYDVSRNN